MMRFKVVVDVSRTLAEQNAWSCDTCRTQAFLQSRS